MNKHPLKTPRSRTRAFIVGALAFGFGTLLLAGSAPQVASASKQVDCGETSTGGLNAEPNRKCFKFKKATLRNGKAIAPASAPKAVKQVIARANEIRTKPYRLGGGHRSFKIDDFYDCSGAVSYALGSRFMTSPLPSGPMMTWGKPGKGKWITVYANHGHAYMVVAGLRFDTANNGSNGPRWSASLRSTSGKFTARSPKGF